MQSTTRLNLENAAGLIVDDNSQALDLLASVLSSFGMKDLQRASSAMEAMEIVKARRIDIILTDGQMPVMDGYDFVRWLRHESGEQTRTIPAIVVTAHSRRTQVMRARDCGANFIITKPITPKVILERILWVAQGRRMFLETDTYIGPDRRFKQSGMPTDFPDGRRRDDKPAEVAAVAGDNLSQDELNNIIAPQKVAL
ncbi:response regulator [Phenylobacterium sp.]|uniref:response regulator n=1 Tax=Phenylobacterium sp. TaxID=1871053 RepID=UPI0027215148|nr:response regulator [Phenylobacterium sp.]MDO8378720.1 response regulator [Phenylobacterium sp.]